MSRTDTWQPAGRAAAMPAAAAHTPEQIASRSGSSFLVSFGLLDSPARVALTAIYAFCRVVDDAGDDSVDAAAGRTALAFWVAELERAERGTATTPLGRALQTTFRDFGVEAGHLQAVAEGIALDLDGARFETMTQLESYCHQVACSVGLACLPVFRVEGPLAECYAVELGHALQLTNILRDLRSDAERGRIYAPTALLAQHGVEPGWLAGGGTREVYEPGGAVDALAGDLAGRARRRFAAAAACLDREFRARLRPPEVMAAVYRALLGRLERRGGRICVTPRVRVPRWQKLWLAWRVRRGT